MISTYRTVLLAGLATGLLATPGLAQVPAASVETAAVADNAVPDSDTIIVTGTRRSDRTVADSTVPIDVIGAEAIQNTGYTETNRVLSQLVPSFNFPQPSITDGTDVIRPATLRGLSPDQTLVLINGKRRHTTALLNINGSVGRGSSAVDINLIPSAALERVEVLRDGAAAQYGSDAIAGVINFQLRRAREGGRISVTYGQYESDVGGIKEITGVQQSAPGVPAFAPDGTLSLVSTGKDRSVSDGKTLTISGNVGIPFLAEGFINVTGEYRDRDPTNRTGYDPRRQFASGAAPFDPREFSFNRLSHRFGDARTEDYNVFVNAGTPLAENLELYAFGSYGHRSGESGGFYRRSNDARNVLSIYPNGFLPLIGTTLRDYAFTGGAKGIIGTVNFDVSLAYAKNKFDFDITNTLNASLGAASGDRFDSGGLRYGQLVANLDLNRTFEVSFLSSFTLAAGLEYRNEDYKIRAGEPDSFRSGPATIGQNNPSAPGNPLAGAAPGAQVFPGFQPVIGGQQVTGRKRERNNFSAYVEADADISERFTVQVAGRFEDYSDFGSDINGKVSARFEPIDGYALRGAVSTGFRAPSLQQQFYAAAATNNVSGVLLDTVTLPVQNPVAIALGSRPLQAETSVSYSAGVVLNPVPALTLTVDFYNIEIDDRIVVTENLLATRDGLGNPSGAPTSSGFQIATILNNAGFRTISAARFFVNGIDTRTRGIDAVATYRFDLGNLGKLRATAGYNYNKTKITGRQATPGALSQVPGVTLFGRQESLRIERGQPRDKINLGLDYDYEILGVTLRGNRYGKVLDGGADAFQDVPLGAKWLVDLEARIKPVEGIEFAVGANNLLDEYPDLIPTGRGVDPVTGAARNYADTRYALPYSSFSPFGFNGRFLYARASFSF